LRNKKSKNNIAFNKFKLEFMLFFNKRLWQIINLKFLLLILITFYCVFCFATWRTFLMQEQKVTSKKQHQFSQLLTQMKVNNNELTYLAKIKNESVSVKNKQKIYIASFELRSLKKVKRVILIGLRKYPLELKSFENISTTKQEDNLSVSKISLIIKGSYRNLGEYLYFLANSSIVMNYEEVLIQSVKNEADSIEMKLVLDLYHY
jgi:Tfp pilus assembly protein PilO